MLSLDDIWQQTLLEMSKTYSKPAMDLWFIDLKLKELRDDEAILLCETDFKRDMVETRHRETIEKNLAKILGFDIAVKFISVESGESPQPQKDEEIPLKTKTPVIPEPNNDKHENHMSSFAKVQKTEYTFDTFVVGNSNKFAHAACIAVANNPAREYNPLFIYGPSGLGKTHLLYAISNRILEANENMNIVYVKGEDFMNQLIETIREVGAESSAEFRDKYRKADVLLIDDIQFIAGKPATQEEFFHTFNALYEDEKQIIMTSDRPPRDIQLLEDRLKSRFEWGLIADIQPPDFELRVAIMKNKARTLGLTIPDEVFNFLAENLRSNVRQLEGAIKKVGAQSLLNKVDITLELAINCTSDLFTGSEPVAVTVDKIFEKVAKKYGITVEDIKGRKRTREIANPRHIAIFIIRKLTDMSLPAIGRLLNRDHTTIMSSLENIESELKANSLMEIEINDIIKEIKE
jgi:chromosomal replication initiator protein DnaA